MKTYRDLIQNYLQKHKKGITSMEAFQLFGCTRLSAVIYDLKHVRGMNIETENVIVKNRYGKQTYVCRYKLICD